MRGTVLFPKINKGTFCVLKELEVFLHAGKACRQTMVNGGQGSKELFWQKAEWWILCEGAWIKNNNSWPGLPWWLRQLKNLPAMQETLVQSLGQEDPLEKGMATHSSILAWRIPWTEEPGGLAELQLSKSQTWLRAISFFLFWAFPLDGDAPGKHCCSPEALKEDRAKWGRNFWAEAGRTVRGWGN